MIIEVKNIVQLNELFEYPEEQTYPFSIDLDDSFGITNNLFPFDTETDFRMFTIAFNAGREYEQRDWQNTARRISKK